MKRTSMFWGLAAGAVLSASAFADDRVLVIPFSVLNVPASEQWMGKGIQENLVADLGRNGGFVPIAFQGQVIVEDNATAARLGRNASAPLAIRGAVQAVGANVRVTAQLIDTKSGDTIRTALVTGRADDLLKLEDELTLQIRGASPAAAPATAGSSPPPPPPPAAATPVILPPAQPQIIVISQPEPDYYPYYQPVYNYPFGYNYSWGYYPIILYRVPPKHHHDDCNDGHHHGGGGGGHGGGNGGQSVNAGFNPTALPLPTNNVLPLPTNNVLPLPTNHVQPLPTNNVLPLPTNNVLPLPTRHVSTGSGRAQATLAGAPQPVAVRQSPPPARVTPRPSAAPVPARAPAAPRATASPNRRAHI